MRTLTGLVLLLTITSVVLAKPNQQSSEPTACPRPAYSAPERVNPYMTRDRQVNVPSADGAEHTLSVRNAYSVTTSHDGDVTLIVTLPDDNQPGLWRYADGELTELIDADTLRTLRTEDFIAEIIPTSIQFVPGTHTALFYTTVIPSTDGIYFEIPLDLWAIDADTGALSEILPYGDGGDFTVAPDGSYIVLSNFDRVRVVDIDGGNPRTAYEGLVGIGAGEGVYWPQVAFDAENPARFVLALAQDEPMMNAGNTVLNVTAFTVSEGEVTSELVWQTPEIFYFGARMSPDMQAVAYTEQTGTQTEPLQALYITGPAVDGQTSLLAEASAVNVIRWLDESHVLIMIEDVAIADTCGDVNPITLDIEDYVLR